MGENDVVISGIKLTKLNFNEILEKIEKYLDNGKRQTANGKRRDGKTLTIFTPNPEIIIYSQKDQEFKKIVNGAQINIPDGQGLIWASRILGKPLEKRISGTDLMTKLVELADQKGLTAGLIGGREGVAVRALECLRENYPNLSGVSLDSPEFILNPVKHEVESIKYLVLSKKTNPLNTYYLLPATDNQARETEAYFQKLAEEIVAKKIDILFVGLGCPKQEYFIKLLTTNYQLPATPLVMMAVGGAFDYLAGEVPRAPGWIRDLGFEWLYRLLRQPWRLKRQLALVKFIFLVMKERLRM